MIRINIDWFGEKGLNNLIRYIDSNLIYGEAQQKIRVLGHHTADNMQKIIKETGYNLDRLATSIVAETLQTTGGIDVGIGRIANLPFYWEMFNNGFKPGASNNFVPFGSFQGEPPMAGKTGGKWEVGNGGYTFFDDNTNKKSVAPIDYVGKSMRLLDLELIETIKDLGATFIENLNKESKKGHYGYNIGGAR